MSAYGDFLMSAVQRDIEGLCARLEHLALAKAPATYRPVNRGFNAPRQAEGSS